MTPSLVILGSYSTILSLVDSGKSFKVSEEHSVIMAHVTKGSLTMRCQSSDSIGCRSRSLTFIPPYVYQEVETVMASWR